MFNDKKERYRASMIYTEKNVTEVIRPDLMAGQHGHNALWIINIKRKMNQSSFSWLSLENQSMQR